MYIAKVVTLSDVNDTNGKIQTFTDGNKDLKKS